MNKVADRIGFHVETGTETGESLSMGEGMQAVPTELSFGDMAKISGAAGVGAALGEGVIQGIRWAFNGDGYDVDAQQVEFKVMGPDGKTMGGMKVGKGKMKDAVDGYDAAEDKKQAAEKKAAAKEAAAKEKAEKKEAAAKEKAEKKEAAAKEKAEKKEAKAEKEKANPEDKPEGNA